MLSAFSERQQALLQQLLQERSGLTVDGLAQRLDISRTAVNQHLASLMQNGFVAAGESRKTGGRPQRVYALTDRGHHLFPKQYSWFSSLMINSMKEEFGSEATARYLRKIAAHLVEDMHPPGKDISEPERLTILVEVMNELAYEAAPAADPAHPGDLMIEAKNCVYHDLAREHPEVCQFDLELLSRFMGMDVTQEECMLRGGQSCRFRFLQQSREGIEEGIARLPRD